MVFWFHDRKIISKGIVDQNDSLYGGWGTQQENSTGKRYTSQRQAVGGPLPTGHAF